MDNERRCTKIKQFILFGVLMVLALLIGWHVYAHFKYKAETVSEREQQDLSDFTESLYELERGNNPYLLKINFQGKTERNETDDVAPQPLLEVNNSALLLEEMKTISLLRRLFDNYELHTHVPENITSAKEQEQFDFLKAILATPHMQKTIAYLENRGVVKDKSRSYIEILSDIWFTAYTRREGHLGSSGFEHVFLAELRGEKALGLHNWVYFAEQERLGNLNYNGYIKIKKLNKPNQFIVSFRAQFYNRTKPYNTIFVGTSPELEMSLYTLCFVLYADSPCPVQLGQEKFYIITYIWDNNRRDTIASAFPSILKNPLCDIKDINCI